MTPPSKSLISVNGTVQPPENAQISVLDRGFLFGDNIFETMVGFYGQLLDSEEHLARLRQSAADLMIPLPWSDEELRFEMEALASQMDAPKFFIRLVVTRGNGMGLKHPANSSLTKLFIACLRRSKVKSFTLKVSL